ncbi:hypothetical protein Daesc_010531 [Daldinia eschscholtzii]|uniref:DUF1996 domain-containing protein n=1 Tax=Daldinia eschscholtzii TaxID=292717 RepID=A0AAX6M7X9_9PEZI
MRHRVQTQFSIPLDFPRHPVLEGFGPIFIFQHHVTFPTGNAYTCPSTHPVKIPQVMLEVVWDTREFNNKDDWPEDGSQPFFLSTGDP